MIPDETVERVREHADIVAVIGEHVKLKRVGNSFRGPCPFHQGKDPNFSVSPKGGYTCFVCHEKGDVFTFVQKRLGLDFVDAVKYVGARSGVEVNEVSRAHSEEKDPRERFWEANAAAAEYFTAVLWDQDIGEPARQYLESRAFPTDAARQFGLGFSPRDPALMRGHLEKLGFDAALQLEAGLLVQKEGEQEPRPRFRNRLMFPIYDPQGRVVAFGGRVIGPGEPKYLNSAESPVFQKGRTLYGLNWSRNAIRRDERALLVEGYFDCVRLMSSGIESVVAPLGTALTPQQAELLHKYTKTVFLLYDSDKAGLKATFRAGDVLLANGMAVHVVTLPDGEDPDTYVRAHGAAGMEAHLGKAIDVFERKLQILQRGGWFTDLRRKRVALDRLLPTIRSASDPITRGLYLARAAEASGVGQDVLERELRMKADGRAKRREAAEAPTREERARSGTPTRRRDFTVAGRSAERELIRLLLHRRQYIEAVAEREGVNFRDPRFAQIFQRLLAGPDEPVDAIATSLDEEAVAVLNELVSDDGGLEVPSKMIEGCVAAMLQREMGEELDQIDRDLPLAEEAEKDRLVRRKQQLTQKIRALGGRQRWKSFGQTRS
jgi:DNA primase